MNKRLIRLMESDLHRIVRESVNRVLNEVKYDGVSYHGDNPYDWKDLSDERYKRFGRDLSDKDLNAAKRNYKNAEGLGYEYGDTRLDGAKRAFAKGDSKEANRLLGDIDGRAEKNMRAIKASREKLARLERNI